MVVARLAEAAHQHIRCVQVDATRLGRELRGGVHVAWLPVAGSVASCSYARLPQSVVRRWRERAGVNARALALGIPEPVGLGALAALRTEKRATVEALVLVLLVAAFARLPPACWQARRGGVVILGHMLEELLILVRQFLGVQGIVMRLDRPPRIIGSRVRLNAVTRPRVAPAVNRVAKHIARGVTFERRIGRTALAPRPAAIVG